MSLYKLVQYLKDYVNLERKKSLVQIKSRITRKRLHLLDYEYKNVKKDVFVDEYERLNVVEDYKRFFNKIKELKSYLVEFNEIYKIKNKIYLPDCIVDGEVCRPIIIIIYDECIFSANSIICKT